MPLIVRNIPLDLDEPEEMLITRTASRLGVPETAIGRHAIVRRSLDARKGRDLRFVYAVELCLDGGDRSERQCVRRARGRNIDIITSKPELPLETGDAPLTHRPIVVGFGPAGMFAALLLAEWGYKPLVLERGRDVRRRHKDVLDTFYREGVFNSESNLLYGEGGAGTYSDGKVYTRVSDRSVRDVLATLCRFGADPDVLVDAKPHIGSDRLPTICRRIRERIEQCGGQVRFESRVDDIEMANGQLTGLRVGDELLPAGPVLLGVGHSARDTITMLHGRGVTMEAKPFQFGVRIEHPQTLVDRWQYGAAAGHPRLPPADYQLVAKGASGDGCDLFSFCMCPGGTILPTNESANLIVTNGASRSSRGSVYANSGFVITIDPRTFGDDPLAGFAFQRKWEQAAFDAGGRNYRVPAQRCADFLSNKLSDGHLDTSYPFGGTWCRMEVLLPESVTAALRKGLPSLARKLPGFDGTDGLITAPESRASAPVRITRDPTTRASQSCRNLYPIGEGAGYAGGIVSAALDGRRTAEALIRNHKPM